MTEHVPPPYLDFHPATRRLRLDPHEPAFFQNPYEAYAWLHTQDGAFFWEDFGFWCFGGYDDVNRLLRDRKFGRQNPAGIPDSRGVGEDRSHLAAFDAVEANSMLELEPPVHTRLRTLVNRAFVSRQVERLRPRVEALANELVDRFEPGQPVDLLPAFAAPLPITIIAEMLGVPVEMGPQLLDWSHEMVAMYMHGRNRNTEDRANAAAREFSDFLRSYAAERRKQPGDDLLSLLLSAQEDGQKLNEDELVSSTILLLNAGHEATVHQAGNAVRALLSQDGDVSRFFTTPEATAATVEECLRFDAPLHMFTRYAYEEMDAGAGVSVKPGEQVGLLLGMANHDPRAFANPAAFEPQRPDQKNVSFGAGIHFCIGAPLARLELQVALKVLFDRLPNLQLAEEPRFRDTYHFHGLERLTVSF
ncbi:unspecific monooxygenase [Mesorhizobium albiziae]|uniref:Unspecific monooxygenase n=1 Tax=Neomesorhizobium albiziae TaxID=335020 RepID=A0A1I4F4K4_9HYPH|nr:cytochrome P450 [Mesorhizobium albiziae]GLS33784.1 cytochrome P450 [Mesorhizobium albiziae]SFL12915.1 unspecific monooxygenase [Mesorhizobium albiziae]